MVKEWSLSDIIDDTMRDISLKVACMEIRSTKVADILFSNPIFLMVTVKGEYPAEIVLQTDKSVLSKISETMKHQKIIEDNEISIYAVEYFNILCGHIIASCNRIYHTRTRFSVPKMIEQDYNDKRLNQDGVLYQSDYECDYGFLRIQVIQRN